MHYLKFRSLARALFSSSLVLILAFLSGITVIVLVVALWLTGNDDLIIPTAVFTGGFILVALLQAILSSRTACQLCQTYVLRAITCSKNPRARPLFGSYRLKVAVTIVFKGKFCCPYCGEEFNIWVSPQKLMPSQLDNQKSRQVTSNKKTLAGPRFLKK